MTTKKKKTTDPELERRTFLKGALTSAATLPLASSVLAGCSSDSSPDEGPTDVVDGTDTPVGTDTADAGPDTTVEPYDPSAVPADDAEFPLAVQAGAMTDVSAIVWGYCASSEPRRLQVWAADGPAPVYDELVTPADGYLKVAVDGLTGATDYRYAFFDDVPDSATKRSIIGRFRTAPPPGAAPVITLAATACTKDWNAPYISLQVTAERPLDAFLHLGDMSYNDEATTLEEYRAEWQATLRDPGYRALLPTVGTYITWDDHEVANNDWSTLPAEQMLAAMDAFFETLPVPRVETNRLWASYRLGDTAEVFVLDCRSERQPDTRGTVTPYYISGEQMSWLKTALSDSPCRFKVIMTSVPITKMTEHWPIEDTWMGYAKQRDELLDHITDGVDGVLFLGGDYHFGAVTRVEATGARAELREILVGPGASTPNPLVGAAELAPALAEDYVPAAQFDYYSTRYAATYLTLDPAAGTVRVEFIDAETHDVLHDTTLSL